MNRLIRMTAFLAILAGTAGCDTVAELTFQDEQLIEAAAQGLVAPACGALNAEKTDAIFRFSVLTSFDDRMTPGRRYAALGDLLDPGKNFTAKDVVFSDGWFFVVDTAGSDVECSDESGCMQGASCLSVSEMGLDQYYYAPGKFCVYPTKIQTVSDPRFTHFKKDPLPENSLTGMQNADGRTIAFVIDNSASLDGSLETGVPDAASATDPWQYRKVGINQFMDGLEMTGESAPRFEFSAHFANGMGSAGVYDASAAWMRTAAVWNDAVMEKYPSPSGYSPIWEAAGASLSKILDSASSGYARMMIAMTDGDPNDNTDEAWEAFRRQLAMAGNMAIHWLEFTAGRPHARYAQVVKAGCGTHYLFDNPVAFSKVMRNIGINSESWWDVDLHFDAQLPEGYTYRLATMMTVSVGASAVTYEAQRMNEQNESIDYRLVFTK